MSKLSVVSVHTISVIAHAAMARDIEKNVEGFKDFYKFWLNERSEKDRQILIAFNLEAQRANKDFAVMFAKGMKND